MWNIVAACNDIGRQGRDGTDNGRYMVSKEVASHRNANLS